MSKSEAYEVVYYTGGREIGEWHRSVCYTTKAEAQECADDIERQGFPCYVKTTSEVDSVGLPEGAPTWWDFKTLKRKGAVEPRQRSGDILPLKRKGARP